MDDYETDHLWAIVRKLDEYYNQLLSIRRRVVDLVTDSFTCNSSQFILAALDGIAYEICRYYITTFNANVHPLFATDDYRLTPLVGKYLYTLSIYVVDRFRRQNMELSLGSRQFLENFQNLLIKYHRDIHTLSQTTTDYYRNINVSDYHKSKAVFQMHTSLEHIEFLLRDMLKHTVAQLKGHSTQCFMYRNHPVHAAVSDFEWYIIRIRSTFYYGYESMSYHIETAHGFYDCMELAAQAERICYRLIFRISSITGVCDEQMLSSMLAGYIEYNTPVEDKYSKKRDAIATETKGPEAYMYMVKHILYTFYMTRKYLDQLCSSSFELYPYYLDDIESSFSNNILCSVNSAMRDCTNIIDSVVSKLSKTVAAYNSHYRGIDSSRLLSDFQNSSDKYDRIIKLLLS